MRLDMPDDPSLEDKPTYYAKGFYVRKLSSDRMSFWHSGSLSGTLAIAVRTSIVYAWVALFNGRADDWQKVILEIDRLIGEGTRSVIEVLEDDLFNKY
jgi:hypothetical protein